MCFEQSQSFFFINYLVFQDGLTCSCQVKISVLIDASHCVSMHNGNVLGTETCPADILIKKCLGNVFL